MRVWTRAYRPFLMGGNVNTPICADLTTSDPFDIGKGVQCVIVVSPIGKVFVVEATTGGIVGSSVDAVKADIAQTSQEVIDAQLAEERRNGNEAEPVTPIEFWKLLRAV